MVHVANNYVHVDRTLSTLLVHQLSLISFIVGRPSIATVLLNYRGINLCLYIATKIKRFALNFGQVSLLL